MDFICVVSDGTVLAKKFCRYKGANIDRQSLGSYIAKLEKFVSNSQNKISPTKD